MALYLLSVSMGNFFTAKVNKYMVKDFEPTLVEVVGDKLIFYSDVTFHSGDKVNINQDLKLMVLSDEDEADTTFVKGTYLVESVDSKNVILDVVTRAPLKVKKLTSNLPELKDDSFSFYKLNGASYFRFFAWLMLVTAIVFIPFALKMKTKTYVQEI